MNFIKLYFRFISVYLMSKIEYGVYYLMDFVMNILYSFIRLLIIWIILNRFGTIQGWNFYQILLLFNINYFAFALAAMFVWNPSRDLGELVREGGLDSILVKPLNPLVNLVIRQFSHGHLVQLSFGIAVFFYCFAKLGITWTVWKVFWFLAVVLGAAFIWSAMMLVVGAMSFWFIKSNAFFEVLIYGFQGFLDYPIKIYHRFVQVVLTFIIPYGFINFYPVQYFLNKNNDYIFYPIFQFITPAIGVVFLIVALKLWHIGLNRYESTGS